MSMFLSSLNRSYGLSMIKMLAAIVVAAMTGAFVAQQR